MLRTSTKRLTYIRKSGVNSSFKSAKCRTFTLVFTAFALGVLLGGVSIKYFAARDFLYSVFDGRSFVTGTFTENFLSHFTSNFLIIILIFFASYCAIGLPVLLLSTAYKGFSIGAAFGCIYFSAGTYGIKYILCGLFVPSFISAFSIIFIAFFAVKSCSYIARLIKQQRCDNTYITKTQVVMPDVLTVSIILIFISAALQGLGGYICRLFIL